VGYDRVYVHLDGDLTHDKWWEGLKAGRVFVSNGPLLRCRANNQLPGHIFKTDAGQALDLNVDAAFESRDPVTALEIVQNGRVVRVVPYSEWKRTGSLGSQVRGGGWFSCGRADVPGLSALPPPGVLRRIARYAPSQKLRRNSSWVPSG
jgi:hypothetical protein